MMSVDERFSCCLGKWMTLKMGGIYSTIGSMICLTPPDLTRGKLPFNALQTEGFKLFFYLIYNLGCIIRRSPNDVMKSSAFADASKHSGASSQDLKNCS